MDAGLARGRRIGAAGTASRVLVGAALLYLAAGAGGLSWGIAWYDAAIGLIALPAVMVAVGLAARRHGEGRFASPARSRSA